jgi:hypothetical protein
MSRIDDGGHPLRTQILRQSGSPAEATDPDVADREGGVADPPGQGGHESEIAAGSEGRRHRPRLTGTTEDQHEILLCHQIGSNLDIETMTMSRLLPGVTSPRYGKRHVTA